ncbi:transposase [Nostoc sp.]
MFQPVHSPQLNPIERLWQFIKHQFKGENFSNL